MGCRRVKETSAKHQGRVTERVTERVRGRVTEVHTRITKKVSAGRGWLRSADGKIRARRGTDALPLCTLRRTAEDRDGSRHGDAEGGRGDGERERLGRDATRGRATSRF